MKRLATVIIGCLLVSAVSYLLLFPSPQMTAHFKAVSEPIVPNQDPVLEIWLEQDGSVKYRGRTLYFRLFEDRIAGFEYLHSESFYDENNILVFEYELKENPLSSIDEKEFVGILKLCEEILVDEKLEEQYEPIGYTFDTSAKLTFLIRNQESELKTFVVNDHPAEFFDSITRGEEVFPSSLKDLLKIVADLRHELAESKIERY